MNRIRLQDLTPEIYYKQSRDFQFIGRLFDIVLNSVKTNTENLYNLPINENSDERLIDLLAMTLGFKSKHNYNVKQLKSLCSAFMTILKNKGNIDSIIIAVRALLNAEGIKEDLQYSLEENNTILNLFIPQTLSDTNLLKDLLIYILPAGMSCNIIKEFRVSTKAESELTSTDEVVIYEGTYANNSNNILLGINSAAKSSIIQTNEYGITEALAKSYPGLLANSDIYRPSTDLYYNITYVTNGGKITNTKNTPYSYKQGQEYNLPKATKTGYNFLGWYTEVEGGTEITKITATDFGNKVFYAHWENEVK